MEDYQTIFDCIDKNIYGTQTNDYWFSDSMRRSIEFIRKYQFHLDSLEANHWLWVPGEDRWGHGPAGLYPDHA